MASAHQLLLHTRLVGLGKRFDRASVIPPTRSRKGDEEDEDDDYNEGDEEEEYGQSDEESEYPTPVARGGRIMMDDSNAAAKPGSVQGLAPVLEKLSEILPSNLEMDTSMMEHLARAAVELHHQRTGRKKSAEGLLASPMVGMIGSSPAAGGRKKENAKIGWSPEEQNIVERATSAKKSPSAIAMLLKNKTEAQVTTYLKNQAKISERSEALEDDLGSPSKKRGGRGRKPPTTAMNTVPDANLDAKSLLKGVLRRG